MFRQTPLGDLASITQTLRFVVYSAVDDLTLKFTQFHTTVHHLLVFLAT